MNRLRLSVATVGVALAALAAVTPAVLPTAGALPAPTEAAARSIPVAQRPSAYGAPVAAVPRALPDEPADAAKLQRVLSVWADAHGLPNATLAVLRDGEIVAAVGHGLGRANIPQPVASLSKAITAMCLNEVLLRRGLKWSATLRDLRGAFDRFGVRPASEALNLTLAQIATHTAGLAPDLTQRQMAAGHWRGNGAHIRFAASALEASAITGTPGDFFYSNTNYAILGTVIEALENRPYGAVCSELVLAPAGVTRARLDGRVGSMSAFAGWELSAADYARFFDHWYGVDQPWMLVPEAFPHAANGYGLGVFTTRSGEVTHDGAICSNLPLQNFGATVRRLADGTVYVATWQGCLDQRSYRTLDQALHAVL